MMGDIVSLSFALPLVAVKTIKTTVTTDSASTIRLDMATK
jgi:hypothetical protein